MVTGDRIDHKEGEDDGESVEDALKDGRFWEDGELVSFAIGFFGNLKHEVNKNK